MSQHHAIANTTRSRRSHVTDPPPSNARSTPSNTSTGPFGLRDFTSCDCDLPEDSYTGPIPEPYADVTNETQILEWLKFSETRNRRCYNSPHWTVTNAAGKEYNFLDYVGTWMLASRRLSAAARLSAPPPPPPLRPPAAGRCHSVIYSVRLVLTRTSALLPCLVRD